MKPIGSAFFGGMVIVALLVHVAFYGWKSAPRGRVDLPPRKRVWLYALVGLPILFAMLITFVVSRLLPGVSPETWLAMVACLLGFAMAVIFGIVPRGEEDDD